MPLDRRTFTTMAAASLAGATMLPHQARAAGRQRSGRLPSTAFP